MKISLPKLNFFSRKPAYLPSRRNAPRVKSLQLLKCLRSDDTPIEIVANLVNLSETGLQFLCGSTIKAGSLLKMVMNFTEAGRQIPVIGKVVWQGRMHSSPEAYKTGVSFISMSFEDREWIRRFVQCVSLPIKTS